MNRLKNHKALPGKVDPICRDYKGKVYEGASRWAGQGRTDPPGRKQEKLRSSIRVN